jgi:hypothetical protein
MKKIYSEMTMRATAFLGGTAALTIFALVNYRVFRPYADKPTDIKKLRTKMFLSVASLLVFFIPISDIKLFLPINLFVCTLIASLWKDYNDKYIKQGGEYVGAKTASAVMLIVAVILVSGFVGYNFINSKSQYSDYKVINALEDSFGIGFRTKEYDSYYQQYLVSEQKALNALDSYFRTTEIEYLDTAEQNWKDASLAYGQMANVKGIPEYLSKKLPLLKKFVDLRIVQVGLLRQDNETPSEAISLRLDANLQLINETINAME